MVEILASNAPFAVIRMMLTFGDSAGSVAEFLMTFESPNK
jgi:hypothetical protein